MIHNHEGFYDDLLRFFERMTREKFKSDAMKTLYGVANSVDEIWPLVDGAGPFQSDPIWKDDPLTPMHRSGALSLFCWPAASAPLGDGRRPLPSRRRFPSLEAHPDCLLRSCLLRATLTGSAWIVSPDRQRLALLTHHRKLEQVKKPAPGGHADGDPALLAVALREAHDESGLARIAPVGRALFDVDRHWIPAPRRTSRGIGTTTSSFIMFEADPAEP